MTSTTSTTGTTTGTTTDDATATTHNAVVTAELDLVEVEAFAMKVMADQAVATNAVLAYLGDRLGVWRTLGSLDRVTSGELAARTGLAERYLREWLAAQAAAGYLEYDPTDTSFRLRPEHAMVLADDDSPAAAAGGWEFVAALFGGTDRLAHAFATGDGVAWGEQDQRLSRAVERFFRPLYATSLVPVWLPAVPGLVERLRAGADVLDVGCGLGAATILMAQEFPASRFVGVDTHAGSVAAARTAAAEAGVADRVTFRTGDAAGRTHAGSDTGVAGGLAPGSVDVVCLFDTLHDLGDPVGALRAARRALRPGGTVLAVEPAAADRLEDNLHPLGLSWYASSTAVCVPGSLSQAGTAGLGAQAGPERLLGVFAEAGFGSAEVAATTMVNQVLFARA
jgi:SAM-dependent methyltransferase